MQHTDRCASSRSVADEVPHAHLLQRCPEGLDVGAMEARLDAPPDRAAVQSGSYLGPRHSVADWWHSTTATEPSTIALTLAEREEISRAMAEGQSVRSIAARLDRAASTVSREIRRNGGPGELPSRPKQRSAAWNRALSSQGCKLSQDRALARIVADKLRLLWSPEQIAGWLKHTYPTTRATACHTRPSTEACSSRRVAP